eukprot:6899363-Pyramimonas_sp.AAC.1
MCLESWRGSMLLSTAPTSGFGTTSETARLTASRNLEAPPFNIDTALMESSSCIAACRNLPKPVWLPPAASRNSTAHQSKFMTALCNCPSRCLRSASS